MEIDTQYNDAAHEKINSLCKKDYNYLFRDIIAAENVNENIGIVTDGHLDARKKVLDNMRKNE